jgi:hypothetical protein
LVRAISFLVRGSINESSRDNQWFSAGSRIAEMVGGRIQQRLPRDEGLAKIA